MKVSKMITAVGTEQLDLLGMNRTTYREQTYLSLKVGRVYVLDPDKKFVPRAMGQPVQVAPATASGCSRFVSPSLFWPDSPHTSLYNQSMSAVLCPGTGDKGHRTHAKATQCRKR